MANIDIIPGKSIGKYHIGPAIGNEWDEWRESGKYFNLLTGSGVSVDMDTELGIVVHSVQLQVATTVVARVSCALRLNLAHTYSICGNHLGNYEITKIQAMNLIEKVCNNGQRLISTIDFGIFCTLASSHVDFYCDTLDSIVIHPPGHY